MLLQALDQVGKACGSKRYLLHSEGRKRQPSAQQVRPSAASAKAAADAALSGATPLQHNAFKLDLARALIERNVLAIAALHAQT